jgi:hypothetical protein
MAVGSLQNWVKAAEEAASKVGVKGASTAVDAGRSLAVLKELSKQGGMAVAGGIGGTYAQHAVDAGRYAVADWLSAAERLTLDNCHQ